MMGNSVDPPSIDSDIVRVLLSFMTKTYLRNLIQWCAVCVQVSRAGLGILVLECCRLDTTLIYTVPAGCRYPVLSPQPTLRRLIP